MGDCCHATGIWTMRPGLAVPAEGWVATLLHALKARLMSTLLSQRAVPLHRALRGYTSPHKWQVPSGSAGLQAEGTWRLLALPLTRARGAAA